MSSAPGIVLAHGIGSRTDLPIPLSLALYGSGMAVVISFAALGLLWPKARLTGDRAGRPIPLGVQRVLDAPALRWALRLLALAIAAFVVVVALAGPRDAVSNLAPYTLYIVFWCGLVAVSLLLGPVWRAINPLRTLHRALSAAGGSDPDEGLRPLPESLGYWPAAASIAVFVWLELVPSWRARPVIVGVFLVAYTTAHLVAAQVYGARWFDRGEGFEVYSTLIGRLAPLGRRDDGRLVLRNPMNGLDGVRAAPGLVAVVAVLIGSTGFDGVTRTKLWRDNVASDGLITGTLGITGTIAVVAIAYLVATRYAGRLGDPDGDLEREPPMSARFAHSVIPIAVGYAVAHYFSLLIFDGQQALILASDPFQTGADLIGTSDRGIDYDLVSTSGIAYVQVGAIVLGHVVGVIAAHDRAVRLFDKRRATRSQYPLLAVMVAFTVGGVALLFGT
ncbi:MAG TPA: hypothetical protein VNA14_14045 [Mycobacteriales bacterium]|nr:hypothetical protein [Mycobacteriales bacterium]